MGIALSYAGLKPGANNAKPTEVGWGSEIRTIPQSALADFGLLARGLNPVRCWNDYPIKLLMFIRD